MKPLKTPCYMMATTAIHKMGDISSDEPDVCIIHSEDRDNYIGSWVTGFGFFNVSFPKKTTRLLTQEEKDKYNELYFRIGSQPPYKLDIE